VLEEQPELEAVQRGPVGDERQVEGGAVPRGEHARLELGDALVELEEQLRLGPVNTSS
jgi:hypothetical protein